MFCGRHVTFERHLNCFLNRCLIFVIKCIYLVVAGKLLHPRPEDGRFTNLGWFVVWLSIVCTFLPPFRNMCDENVLNPYQVSSQSLVRILTYFIQHEISDVCSAWEDGFTVSVVSNREIINPAITIGIQL